ncbi:hypothetical protein SAMN04515666_10538 [Bosea lupini]|uniref:MAE-28990/MAE-18760-like HEPN domain-containing protein n=1 Tax=Bosea lupini TaxID=1036779 RepID=A0A1H7SFG7_9HYPH|nr:hypothetical protein SAMN04515666_10538 [Bosea lupini]
MRALTIDDLQSILDSELVWRRREMSSLVTLLKSNTEVTQKAIIRAGVPLLYAHWEGFGRECFVRYFEYVSYRKLKFRQLSPAFLYMSSFPSMSTIQNGGIKNGIDAINSIIKRMDSTNKDPFRKRISTKSNLRSDALEDLMLSCGLDTSELMLHSEFIDKELCDSRNEIAHGSGAAPSLDAFLKRRDTTFTIMTTLHNTVVNAAINQKYKAAA